MCFSITKKDIINRKKSGLELTEERETKFEKSQYEEFINKTTLTSEEAWSLTRKNFRLWCQKHYYPGLVSHFNKHLDGFTDWQKECNINDKEIIQLGLSIFLAPNKLSSKNKLYILNAKSEKFDYDYVSYTLRKNGTNIIGDYVEYKKKKTFISYSDWCYKNGIHPHVLKVRITKAPKDPSVRIILEGRFELLKVGGISAQDVNDTIKTHDKNYGFVNLSMLNISNTAKYGGNYQLIFNYCIVNNLYIENAEVVFPNFNYCELREAKFINSTLEQFQFNDCYFDGTITDCNITNTNIRGGNFRPVLKNTFISNVKIDPIKGLDHKLEYAYKMFKNLYRNQGDDDSARKYHYLEKIEDMKKSKPLSKFF